MAITKTDKNKYIVIVSAGKDLLALAVQATSEEEAGNSTGLQFINVYPDNGEAAILHDPYKGTSMAGTEVPIKVTRPGNAD